MGSKDSYNDEYRIYEIYNLFKDNLLDLSKKNTDGDFFVLLKVVEQVRPESYFKEGEYILGKPTMISRLLRANIVGFRSKFLYLGGCTFKQVSLLGVMRSSEPTIHLIKSIPKTTPKSSFEQSEHTVRVSRISKKIFRELTENGKCLREIPIFELYDKYIRLCDKGGYDPNEFRFPLGGLFDVKGVYSTESIPQNQIERRAIVEALIREGFYLLKSCDDSEFLYGVRKDDYIFAPKRIIEPVLPKLKSRFKFSSYRSVMNTKLPCIHFYSSLGDVSLRPYYNIDGVFTKPHLKYYSGEGKYLLNNFIEV